MGEPAKPEKMQRFILILCLFAGMATAARARTLHVPGDATDLRAGLAGVAMDDTVLVAAGVYRVVDLPVGTGVVLRGATGQAADVIFDAQGEGRHLAILAPGGILRIEAITFRNGLAGGAGDAGRGGSVSVVRTEVRFRDCIFDSNTAAVSGGAVHADASPLLEFVGCRLVGNAAESPGIATPGGAIAVAGGDSEGALVLDHCVLAGNRSGGPGGAVHVDDAQIFMNDTEITGSRSGLVSWPAGAGVFLRRNLPSPGGDAAPDFLVRVADCILTDNVGNVGQAPYSGDGGAILIKGFDRENRYDVEITGTVFADNYNAQGAGVYVGRYAQGVISRCRFLGNRAYANGGAAAKGGRWSYCVGETARFEFCEFVGNDAGYDRAGELGTDVGFGGAFYARYYPRGEFYHCSFSDNRCGGTNPRGDAIYHNSEGRTFVNDLSRCAVVNSVFYGTGGLDVQVRADTNGFSTVSHGAWAPGQYLCAGVDPVGTVDLVGDPFRGPGDLHPGLGSPCIDAGLDLGLGPDLVGTAVPAGTGPDIGAYESLAVSAVEDPGVPGVGMTLQAAPNPFNPRTTLSFTVEREGTVKLDCHDVAGRRVRRLWDGVLPAGRHHVVWDGRDDAGRGLASAVYLVRFTAAGQTGAARVLLLK